jgi:hypothetical protein
MEYKERETLIDREMGYSEIERDSETERDRERERERETETDRDGLMLRQIRPCKIRFFNG